MERKMDVMMSQTEKTAELKKHVAIIHSSNKLTLLQRKIANALLFNAYKDLQEKDEHTIHISKLCDIIGYDSHDHKTIKKALINLISTVLEWNLVDGERLDKEGVWNASSIIAGASIQGSICNYSYSIQMRRLLYRPNLYGRLDMSVQAKFQSTYGLALYENCNRFQDIGQTPWFTIANFRKLMGVEDGKYKIFRDFKNRVLDKAIEEVNQYSALEIIPKLRKQNRQVISIQFLIRKSKMSMPLSDHHDCMNTLKKQFSFSEKQVSDVVMKYGEKYIKEKIQLVLSSASYQAGKVKNLTRYLMSALRDDYQIANTGAAEARNPVAVVHQKKLDIGLQTQFRRFEEDHLFALFNSLPDKQKNSIISKFDKFLVGVYNQVFQRDGFKNVLIREQLTIYLKKINHSLVNHLPSYDDWVAKNRVDQGV